MPNIVLQTEGLNKSYDSLVVMKDLTLEVDDGQVYLSQ